MPDQASGIAARWVWRLENTLACSFNRLQIGMNGRTVPPTKYRLAAKGNEKAVLYSGSTACRRLTKSCAAFVLHRAKPGLAI
jgi:hypothetical protein